MLQLTETQKNQTYEISLKSNGIVIGSFVKIDGFFIITHPKKDFGDVIQKNFSRVYQMS